MTILTGEWRAHFAQFDDEQLAQKKADAEQAYKDAQYYERWADVEAAQKRARNSIALIVAEQTVRSDGKVAS